MSEQIKTHRDLIVCQKSFVAGKRIFELSKAFPREEMYSLTDQMRRSSRSVSANIAEAWRKRRYEKHFCSTLNIAEAEAAETQVWIEYASVHGYLDAETTKQAIEFYDEILRMIVAMIYGSSKWCVDFKLGVKGSGVKESGENYIIENDCPVLDQQLLLAPTSPTLTSERSDA
ncbi:four helix bundle protein [Rhodopirellula bahusiensis]|uniref:Four helix bundle protein n=1 Tax=Rhodopirellula bahusiensis TaxID=2014065 RepID=A0A2G1W7S9_9BACT|nr:four helix bundle protein [Rhodopirellula bahusiensis]PHQ35092.1 four helix bundle protein [Rhodopirellula bahusiensis]